MGEEIFTFLRESKYSVSLITVPFCPFAPCPFQILAGVLICVIMCLRIGDLGGRGGTRDSWLELVPSECL